MRHALLAESVWRATILPAFSQSEIGWQARTAQSHVLHSTRYLGVNTQPVLPLPGNASTLSSTESPVALGISGVDREVSGGGGLLPKGLRLS